MNDMPSHLYQLQLKLREREAMLVEQQKSVKVLQDFVKEYKLYRRKKALERWAAKLKRREHALAIRWQEMPGNFVAIVVLAIFTAFTIVTILRNAAGL